MDSTVINGGETDSGLLVVLGLAINHLDRYSPFSGLGFLAAGRFNVWLRFEQGAWHEGDRNFHDGG